MGKAKAITLVRLHKGQVTKELLRTLRGPKDWKKNQDFTPGLKLSSDQSQIEIFNRDWNFKRATQQGPFLWGMIKVGIWIFKRDLKFSSRLKISSLDWNFKRMDWNFHAINRDWFSQSQSPLGFCCPRLRWSGDSQRESGRFVRIDSQKSLHS